MIQKLKIENFQSWRNGEFVFSPGLNVFIGKSNSGKTAVFRTFYKMLRNSPDGNFFITDNEDQCKITVNNAERILKRRQKKDGSYDLTDNSLNIEGLPFEKLGRGLPPDELFKYLNISKPVEVAGIEEDFNFVLQKDPSFLLPSKIYTPSVIAKFFDELSGIGVLNLCLQEVKSRQRNNNSTVAGLEALQKERQKEKDSYSYVPLLEQLLEVVNKRDEYREKLSKLQQLQNKLRDCNISLKNLRNIVQVLQSLTQMSIRLNSLMKFDQASKRLFQLQASLGKVQKVVSISNVSDHLTRINKLRQYLKYSTLQKHAERLQRIASVCDVSDRLQRIKVLQQTLRYVTLEKQIKDKETTMEGLSQTIANKHAEYHQALEEHGVCPTCGRQI